MIGINPALLVYSKTGKLPIRPPQRCPENSSITDDSIWTRKFATYFSDILSLDEEHWYQIQKKRQVLIPPLCGAEQHRTGVFLEFYSYRVSLHCPPACNEPGCLSTAAVLGSYPEDRLWLFSVYYLPSAKSMRLNNNGFHCIYPAPLCSGCISVIIPQTAGRWRSLIGYTNRTAHKLLSNTLVAN